MAKSSHSMFPLPSLRHIPAAVECEAIGEVLSRQKPSLLPEERVEHLGDYLSCKIARAFLADTKEPV